MPKSIQRGFIVEDRHFLTYGEARRFASENKAALARADLINLLRTLFNASPYDEAEVDDADEFADVPLLSYEIKPKKRND